ncbi:hypothetical protein [Nocardioides marmorisolisilvae]|uniref:Uncharacterized protein n=1 Tax=Nocardioides marmorisolisilvae TaxID=1542737 RepID=A0A3N0DSK5_9ACTN|nr:hypothetical protein [Nocardioides marmorisolisilvae]RNL78612.1 hypothetical protein EFL95_05860 [Nocardioides marmorisolisilvae]
MTDAAAPADAAPTRRRPVLRGFVLGVVITMVVLGLTWAGKQLLDPGVRSFATTCSGAKVTGTIWVESSGVNTTVVIDDPKQRGWRVVWGRYGEAADSSLKAPPVPELLVAAATLGDTDDGTHRTARLRPDGAAGWCDLKMHVYRFW